MSRIIELANVADLVKRYNAGESAKKLADEFGISRGKLTPKPYALMRILVEGGAKIRGRSEAEKTKWKAMKKVHK